jgi:hypothetical protein
MGCYSSQHRFYAGVDLHARTGSTRRGVTRVAVPNGGGGRTPKCGLVPLGLPADTDARTIPVPRTVGVSGPGRLIQPNEHSPLVGGGPGVVVFIQVVEAIMRFGRTTSRGRRGHRNENGRATNACRASGSTGLVRW